MNTIKRQGLKKLLSGMAALCALLSGAHAQACALPPGGNPTCGSTSTSQSSPNPSTGVGNPIDLTSGNKYQQEIDIDMPGELSIDFRRHYNSMQGWSGVLGRGWSHTYETRLSRSEKRADAAGHGAVPPSITIIQGDGREINFEPFETADNVRRFRSIPAGFGVIEEDIHSIERLRTAKRASELAMEPVAVWKWRWADGRTLSFNGRGLLKAIEEPDGRALHTQFDAQRRFTRVTDSAGNWLAASYWEDAVKPLQPFASGGVAARGVGFPGRLKSLTLSTGETIAYEYDSRGNLLDVVYADGTIKRYQYDRASGQDLLSKIYGRDGKLAASYEYDATGHATKSSHPDHRDDVTVSYQWPGRDHLGRTTLENAAGEKTNYTWRADPRAQSPVILSALGPGCRFCATSNVRYEYDAHQRVARSVRLDANGLGVEQQVYSIDDLGRTRSIQVSQIIDGKPQAPQWQETREYAGNSLMPSLITRPSVVPGHEHTLRVEYNDRGQPTRIVEKGFQFAEPQGFERVSFGASQGSEIERVTVLEYVAVNGLSLLHSIDGPLPGPVDTWTYHYDGHGRLVSITSPGNLTERFERDAWGRVTVHTGLDGVRETLEYGVDGNITRFARGDTWMRIGYDEAGRIAKIADSLGQLLDLKRDDSGELVEISDPAGNRIEWTYGDHGELRTASLLNPDGTLSQRGHPLAPHAGSTASRAPDPLLMSIAGLVPEEALAAIPGLHANPDAPAATAPASTMSPEGFQTVSDVNHRVTTYAYDDFGRMTAQYSPVSGTTRYRFDAADHLVERCAADGSITQITRDGLGRAVRLRTADEDGQIEWGKANRPTRVTFRAGEERFDYDDEARLVSHELIINGKRFRISYEFDSLGRLARKRLPDGSVLRYRYNGNLHPKPGVLAGIYKEGLVDVPIIVGMNGADERYSDREFTFGNGLTQRRVLDVDGNVVAEGNSKVGESRLDWSRAASPATYIRTASVGEEADADSTLPLSNRLAMRISAFSGGDFSSVDPAEDVHADAASYFVGATSYDARGEMIDDGSRRYEWDALGRMARVSTREATGLMHASTRDQGLAVHTIAEYRYNLFGERIAKITMGPQGAKVSYFVWDGDQLAAEMDQNGKAIRDYVYAEDRPVAMLSGSAIYAIHTDHRMAPLAVTDANRQVVWQATVHDNGAADVLPGSRIEMPLRASNQYFDVETGLHYNLYRYLDARRGRYLSPDPMGLAAGPDLYQFALGRPHTFIDPLGLQTVPGNTDVSGWSFAKKLTAVFQLAAKQLPSDLASALLNLVSPANVATTVGIFALWATSHAYGVGELFDAAALAVMYVSLGAQAGQIITGLISVVSQINNAKCYSDLNAPASTVSKALGAGAAAFVQAAVLHKLFGSAETNVGTQGEAALENSVNDGEAGTISLTTTTAEVPFGSLIGKQFSVGELTNIAARNDGVLGEQIAQQIVQEETGLTFQGIQNASGNGPDLLALQPGVNGGQPTVIMVEVKSSVNGTPKFPTGSGVAQLKGWLTQIATTGKLNNQTMTQAQINYAKTLLTAINKGANIESTVMQVSIPPTGQTGVPTAILKNWP